MFFSLRNSRKLASYTRQCRVCHQQVVTNHESLLSGVPHRVGMLQVHNLPHLRISRVRQAWVGRAGRALCGFTAAGNQPEPLHLCPPGPRPGPPHPPRRAAPAGTPPPSTNKPAQAGGHVFSPECGGELSQTRDRSGRSGSVVSRGKGREGGRAE